MQVQCHGDLVGDHCRKVFRTAGMDVVREMHLFNTFFFTKLLETTGYQKPLKTVSKA